MITILQTVFTWISIKISLQFVPMSALVQVMARCQRDYKPLPELDAKIYDSLVLSHHEVTICMYLIKQNTADANHYINGIYTHNEVNCWHNIWHIYTHKSVMISYHFMIRSSIIYKNLETKPRLYQVHLIGNPTKQHKRLPYYLWCRLSLYAPWWH